jgi:hypothetical protein
MQAYDRSWAGDNVRYETGHLGTTQFRLMTNVLRQQIYGSQPMGRNPGFTQVGKYKEVLGLPEDVYGVLVGMRGDTLSTQTPSHVMQDSGAAVVSTYMDGMWVPQYDVVQDAADGVAPNDRTTAQVWEHRVNVWAHLHCPSFCGIKRATDKHLGGKKNTQTGGKSVTAIISGDTTIQNTTGKTLEQMQLLCLDMRAYILEKFGPNPVHAPSPDDAGGITAPVVVYKGARGLFGDEDTTTRAANGQLLDLWQAQPFAKVIKGARKGESAHIILLNNLEI